MQANRWMSCAANCMSLFDLSHHQPGWYCLVETWSTALKFCLNTAISPRLIQSRTVAGDRDSLCPDGRPDRCFAPSNRFISPIQSSHKKSHRFFTDTFLKPPNHLCRISVPIRNYFQRSPSQLNSNPFRCRIFFLCRSSNRQLLMGLVR